MTRPLTSTELERIGSVGADPPSDAGIEVALTDSIYPDAAADLRIERTDRGTRLVGRVGVDGWSDLRDLFRPDDVELSRVDLDGPEVDAEETGFRPGGVATVFAPTRAPRVWRDMPAGKRCGSIFDTDDRYLFHDQTFPWRITGKLFTAGGTGSGTVIGPRHVLTASHVVDWTRDEEGLVGWINFTPGYYDGRGPWGTFYADTVVYWIEVPGPTSTDSETAFDYAVLVFSERIGDVTGYAGYRTYDADWNGGAYWQSIGYPDERASGERPAFEDAGAVQTISSQSTVGRTGYVMGHFKDFTAGQSGGPAWGWWADEPWPRVVGVGCTIGDTTITPSTSATTSNDNEYGGGPALSALIGWTRANYS